MINTANSRLKNERFIRFFLKKNHLITLFLLLSTVAYGQSFETVSVNPFSLSQVTGGSNDVAFGDLNGDGLIDILSGNSLGRFYFFENEGTSLAPSFKTAVENPFSLTDIGQDSRPFIIDLNGDGLLDVVSGENGGDFYFFENEGTTLAPSFKTAVQNPFGLSRPGGRSSITFVDLDGDGDLDALSGKNNGDFTFQLNSAGAGNTPVFGAGQTNPFGLASIGGRSVPRFTDLDGDGDFDMLSGHANGSFYYFENSGDDGNPAFESAVTNPFSITDVGTYSAPGVADLDGDGDLDLMVGENGGGFYYFENLCANSISYEYDVYYQTDSDPSPTISFSGGVFSANSTDLIINTSTGEIDVSASVVGTYTVTYTASECGAVTKDITIAKKPTFATVVMNPFNLNGISDYSNPTLADIDNDGDLDLLTGRGDGSFSYFENIGTAMIADFDEVQTNPFNLEDINTTASNAAPIFIDIDEDTDFDIITGTAYGDFHYYKNTGSISAPDFAAQIIHPFEAYGVDFSIDPSMADLDGDGDIDILNGGFSQNFQYYENTAGDGNMPSFASPVSTPFGLPDDGYLERTALADLDGDGDIDLLVNDGGVFKYFINIGTPQNPVFSQNTSSSISLPDRNRGTPTFADLDNDGDLDILTGAEDGNFYYHRNLEIDNLTAYVAISQELTCQGGSDGSIAASPTGGDGDYSYAWDNGITETTATVSGLAVGTYTVTVTDGIGATSTATITLDDGPLEDADFSYDASVYITTGSNPTPTIATPGGSFSSAPMGLIFEDDNTGEIAVASSEVGTYTVTYTTATCGHKISKTIEITNTLTWDGDEGTAWATANNWDFNVAPSSSNNLVIPDVTFDPSIFVTDEVVNNLEIQSGATLTIAGGSLKVNVDLVLSGDISVASEASLLLMGSVSGGGSATINRNTTFGTADGKYSVIGSPITSGSTSSLGSIVYKYDESIAFDGVGNNRFVRVNTPETMSIGDAYFSANTGDIFFTGTPNSENVDIALAYTDGIPSRVEVALPNDYALVSNPYTAAISYDLLMAGNTDIDGTLYFWDDGGSNVEQRDNSDYITATSMGAAGGGSTRSTDWDGYIRSTQGFFVAFNSSGTFHLTPTMMVTSNNDDDGYFRKAEGEIMRFALSSNDLYSDILIGFSEEATADFDRTLDAYKLKGNGDLQLYSRMREEIMAIQALPVSLEERTIDLGFDAAKAGTYSLSISDLPESDLQVLLIDHSLNKKVNLNEVSTYTFTTSMVEDSYRFSLLFAPNEVLSVETEEPNNDLLIYSKGGEVFMKTKKEIEGATVGIYTLNGTLIQQISNVTFKRSKWSTSFNGEGIFIITVQSGNELLVSKFLK